tara:strand:+ start:489 stop:641 length:153 start_codon:yes stop_codon:yes gene_type:complete
MAASSLSVHVLDPGGSVLKLAMLDVSAIIVATTARALGRTRSSKSSALVD